MKGTIKNLNERGYGFIKVEGQTEEIFFHSSALVGVQFNELQQGDAVSFETEQKPDNKTGQMKTSAINVERA